MKKTNLLLLITCVVTVSIFSCSKDDEIIETIDVEEVVEVEGPTEQEIFMTNLSNDGSKTWGEGDFNLEGIGIETCRFDDLMTLKNDLTYFYDNGTVTCGEDSLTKTGVWEADFDNQTITFDKGTLDEYEATITSITSTSLSLEGTWNNLEITGDYTVQ